MKVGMILGIIGGVIALLIGAVGFSVSSAAGALSSSVGYSEGASSAAFYKFAAISMPIVGLVGAGIVNKNPDLAAILMGASTLGILFAFGIGFLSLVPAVLLGLGAVLVMLDKDKGPYQKT